MVWYLREEPPRGGWRAHQMILPAILLGLPVALVLKQPDLGTAMILVLRSDGVVPAGGATKGRLARPSDDTPSNPAWVAGRPRSQAARPGNGNDFGAQIGWCGTCGRSHQGAAGAPIR